MKKVNYENIKKSFCKDFPISTTKELSEKYKISIFAVARLKKEWQLEKDKSHFKRIFQEKKNKNGIFKKGNIPPLKGKKVKDVFSVESYEKFKKIGFKKGCKPANTNEVGFEKVYKKANADIIYIKTKEHSCMVPKHIYIWEQTYGRLKDGMVLRFKDSNTLNCTLENLECVTKEYIMLINSKNCKYPKELMPIYADLAKINNLIIKKSKNI